MSEQQREQEPGHGPVGDQREDGVVVEPGAELDRDLEQQGLGAERPGDEPDPHFRPQGAAASVRDLTSRLPAELRPAFEDAVAALDAAGPSVQPAELADLQRTLAPVGDWLRRACAEPTPSN